MMEHIKDPMNWKVWSRFILLFVLLVPWYFPKSMGEKLVFGIPLWALLIIIFLICLVLSIIDVTRNRWDLEAFISKEDKS
jgi:uncharacterized membrane protein